MAPTFWQHKFEYNHPWETVSMAIWQKYPNPFASHVITADTIDRSVDPVTGVLTTTRLFLKQGKMPKWGQRLLHAPEAFILETSTVDPVSKTMTTVTRNLSHVKIMLVEERQIIKPLATNPHFTEVHTSAKIISNTNWVSIRSRIEGFGLKRLKDNTVKSSKGLLHVIEQLTTKKEKSSATL